MTATDGASPATHETGSTASTFDWKAYYVECHKFGLYQGNKFTSLLSQASVFALAVCAAIVTAAEKLKVSYPQNWLIAGPALAGLCAYGSMIVVSFLQTRAAGSEMVRIERDGFGFPAGVGLLSRMRSSSAAFFGRTWTLYLVLGYLLAMMGLVIASAILSRVPPS